MWKKLPLIVILLTLLPLLPSSCSYDKRPASIAPIWAGPQQIEERSQDPKKQPDTVKNPPEDTKTIGRENRYDDIIRAASKRYCVESALVKAIVKVESDFDPRVVSPKGACGLMQLMPATANELGVQNCFSPQENINGGVKYFQRQIKRFNRKIEHALAAYNAGPGRVKQYAGVPPFPETQHYIERVLSYHQEYRDESLLASAKSEN